MIDIDTVNLHQMNCTNSAHGDAIYYTHKKKISISMITFRNSNTAETKAPQNHENAHKIIKSTTESSKPAHKS
jgi:hypothetical protein